MTGESRQAKTINILLAEDNEVDRRITKAAFDKMELKNAVFEVEDGQQAIDFLYHTGNYADAEQYPKPDLILLDITMPNIDGYGVLEKIKNDEILSSIPVVMLTASEREEDMVKSCTHGATSYIQKPVTYENFLKVVSRIFINFYE